MEHLLVPRKLIMTGWASASRTLMGASGGNLLLCMPAQVRGQSWSTATWRWCAYVASILMCLMVSSNFPWRVVRALRGKPQVRAKADLYSRWTFCQGKQMSIAAS
eukprot:9491491-Pyramimonas_sp.AAC.1